MASEATATAIGCGLTIFRSVIGLLATLFHTWTMIIAYNHRGFLAAAVSFFLPVLSEIYWLVILTQLNGYFLHPYAIFFYGLLALWVIFVVAAMLVTRDDG